jgi:hypothetical protein
MRAQKDLEAELAASLQSAVFELHEARQVMRLLSPMSQRRAARLASKAQEISYRASDLAIEIEQLQAKAS